MQQGRAGPRGWRPQQACRALHFDVQGEPIARDPAAAAPPVCPPPPPAITAARCRLRSTALCLPMPAVPAGLSGGSWSSSSHGGPVQLQLCAAAQGQGAAVWRAGRRVPGALPLCCCSGVYQLQEVAGCQLLEYTKLAVHCMLLLATTSPACRCCFRLPFVPSALGAPPAACPHAAVACSAATRWPRLRRARRMRRGGPSWVGSATRGWAPWTVHSRCGAHVVALLHGVCGLLLAVCFRQGCLQGLLCAAKSSSRRGVPIWCCTMQGS